MHEHPDTTLSQPRRDTIDHLSALPFCVLRQSFSPRRNGHMCLSRTYALCASTKRPKSIICRGKNIWSKEQDLSRNLRILTLTSFSNRNRDIDVSKNEALEQGSCVQGEYDANKISGHKTQHCISYCSLCVCKKSHLISLGGSLQLIKEATVAVRVQA